MMTMCPNCFELYSEIWSKPCCSCGFKTISVNVELIIIVKMFLLRGFRVSSASCHTHKAQDDNGKITQISIEFGTFYP